MPSTTTPAIMPACHSLFFACSLSVICLQALTVQAQSANGAGSQSGKAIFLARCAACHGQSGEGVADEYDAPLTGDATVEELTKTIAETMPEDNPQACIGADAAAVARYIYTAFYSPAAVQRNQPPQQRLARLTATQLRQSLADLYSRFTGAERAQKHGGLQAEYFAGTNRRREQRRIERTDPGIDFDFGNDGPGAEIDPKEFSIQWQGGVRAETSGSHEFVIRSTCAFIFYLGTGKREFINNHVQSGDKTEFRQSIVLTAGRCYPLKLVFYQRKRKTKQPPARISLAWIPPGGSEHIIPARNLTSERVPDTFTLQAALPPDDRSYGYERGISVDRQWDDSTTAAAIEFAEVAHAELWPIYQRRHQQDPQENRQPLRNFLAEVLKTAFRGPLDPTLREVYIDRQVDATDDDAVAIKRALLMALKSPRFLYPLLDDHRSKSQQVANRLSLILHDSLPVDEWLIKQAATEKLLTPTQIRQAANRLAADPRSRNKTRALLHSWLNLEHLGEITKDPETYTDFDAALVQDLRISLDAFLDDVVTSEASDFRQLLQADWVYSTPRLERFYGQSWQASADAPTRLRRSVSAPDEHLGVLTHPYLMSGLAYRDSTSPIHRGVFLMRHILGRTLRPPQEAFTPLSPDLHPDLTTRERIALQTSPEGCQTCHIKINGLGFTLENFDAVGRYRKKEKERTIDSQGHYTTRDHQRVTFQGSRELADFLVTSQDVHRAFVDRAFEHFVKQPALAFGPQTLDQLTTSFQDNEFNIQKLLIEIAVIAAQQPQPATALSATPD